MNKDKQKQEKFRKYYDEDYFPSDSPYRSYIDLFKSRLRQFRIRQFLKLYVPSKKDRILDLGCAMGHICFAFAPYCKEIVGLDYSKTAIQYANQLLKTSPFKNIRFMIGSSDNIKLLSCSFDLIISGDLFEHLYPAVYKKTLDECSRLLKKGGHLIIWTPNKGHIIEILKKNNIIFKKDISHVDYKNLELMKKDLQERGFLIKKAYYTESHIFLMKIIEKIFLSFIPFFRRRIAILAEKKS